MKKLFFILSIFWAVTTTAQVSSLDKLQVKTSIKLRTRTMVGISNDTSIFSFDSTKFITEYAAKTFALLNGSGGGGGSTIWGGITGSIGSQTDLQAAFNAKSDTGHTHTFNSLTSKPTTLAGYGITDNITTQGNSFNTANKLLLLNSAGAIPAIDGGLLTGLMKTQVGLGNVPNVDATNANNISSGTIPDARLSANVPLMTSGVLPAVNGSLLSNLNGSNIASGTVADARLSSNVMLLNSPQTITANKLSTALTTARGNNIDSIQDLTKGFVAENLTPSTISIQKRYSPPYVWTGQAYNAGISGSGLVSGSNTFQWKAELRAITDNANGGNASRTENDLVFSQKFGTNDWVDVARFTKNGISAPLVINTITLGQSGIDGVINLRRASDGGGTGRVAASSAGGISITGSNVIIGANTGTPIYFNSNPNFGMTYVNNAGLSVTTVSNSTVSPASHLVVPHGGASIGANAAAPTNGLIVAGRTRLTGLEAQIVTVTSNYTVTETDHTILVDATSGNVTITLRTAVGSKQLYHIKRIDNSGNTVTVATTSSQTIDGATTYTGLSAQYKYVQVQANGAAYYIISNN